MDPMPVINLIALVMIFILYVDFLWRVSKLKPPKVFYLLDFVCYKTPFAKKEPENQTELYTSPNQVENVVYEMVDELLKKTKANIKNIGVLVCVFNGSASVSLSSTVLKRYKLNEDIASYDLYGKGSTSGLMAVTLAKHLLQAKPDCCALVLTTEELPESRHVITANDSSIPPTYRPSGAAILLSNRTSDSSHAKYKLLGAHNVHLALPLSTPPPGTSLPLSTPPPDDATSASEKVVRSSMAFRSSLLARAPRRRKFMLCQAGGDPMVGAAERIGYHAESSRLVRSRFGYEPVTSLWYRLAEFEARKKKFDKGDWVSQTALWTDWSDFKGTTLVWEGVDRREKKIKPMVFKSFGDVDFRQYFPK